MDQHIIKIYSVDQVTHDVLRFKTEKPADFNFIPGQASRISINKEGWEKKKRSFTFTNLPDDDHLEFIIKTYPSLNGVTNELLTLKKGDELIVHEVWGSIAYKGPGVFIAGGAGVTPCMAEMNWTTTSFSLLTKLLLTLFTILNFKICWVRTSLIFSHKKKLKELNMD